MSTRHRPRQASFLSVVLIGVSSQHSFCGCRSWFNDRFFNEDQHSLRSQNNSRVLHVHRKLIYLDEAVACGAMRGRARLRYECVSQFLESSPVSAHGLNQCCLRIGRVGRLSHCSDADSGQFCKRLPATGTCLSFPRSSGQWSCRVKSCNSKRADVSGSKEVRAPGRINVHTAKSPKLSKLKTSHRFSRFLQKASRRRQNRHFQGRLHDANAELTGQWNCGRFAVYRSQRSNREQFFTQHGHKMLHSRRARTTLVSLVELHSISKESFISPVTAPWEFSQQCGHVVPLSSFFLAFVAKDSDSARELMSSHGPIEFIFLALVAKENDSALKLISSKIADKQYPAKSHQTTIRQGGLATRLASRLMTCFLLQFVTEFCHGIKPD